MKNRQIWSPGSVCEREQDDITLPICKWSRRDDEEAPLELVKRCRSSPESTERPTSTEPRRCPSAPAHQSYQLPLPPPADLNYSLLLKNENKNEKTFQVRRFKLLHDYFNALRQGDINQSWITVQFPFKMY